jgi:hypothetical protein
VKRARHDQGIALVVVVLSAAVLLSILFAVISTVSISSRRVTSDQSVSLQAQYASESGIARVLGDASSDTGDLRAWAGLISSLQIPALDASQVTQLAAQFCNLAAPTTAMQTTVSTSTTATQLCPTAGTVLNPADTNIANRYQMFAQYVPFTVVAPETQTAYQKYLLAQNFKVGGVTPSTQAQADTFWQAVFNTTADKYIQNVSSSGATTRYRATFGLVPVKVEVAAGGSSFNFVFRPSSVTSRGEVLNGTNVTSSRVSTMQVGGEFKIQIQPASFAYFTLLTNNQTSGAGGDRVAFSNTTMYDGPVHTNGRFTYVGKSWFSNALTSSGCESGYTVSNNAPTCSSTALPGAYTSSTGTSYTSGDPPNLDASGGNFPQTVKDGASVSSPTLYSQYVYKGDYKKKIIPLPTASTTQKNDAQTGGIYIPIKTSNQVVGDTVWVDRMELSTADASGNGLNPDPAQRTVDATYQMIKVIRWQRTNNCNAKPTGVSVDPVTATIGYRWTRDISARVQPAGRTLNAAPADQSVTWSKTSGGGTISTAGPSQFTTYTAPSSATTAKIKATTRYGTTFSATSTITVVSNPPTNPPSPPSPPPPPPPPPGSLTQLNRSPSATLVAGPCSWGGPVDYDFPWYDEYRSSKPAGSTKIILEKRTYPDNDDDTWNAISPAVTWTDARYPWTQVQADFNGVVYADGADLTVLGPWRWDAATPNSAPPAVAKFSKLNIVGSNSINIANDIKYEKPLCYDVAATATTAAKYAYPIRNADGSVTPANCDNPKAAGVADNILGMYTANGDINYVHWGDYQDATIHGVLMASQGRVRVNDVDGDCNSSGLAGGKGNLRLLGGIIQNYYGAWGRFDANGNISCGYGRAVTYDKRMADPTVKPPSFPTASNSTAWGLKLYRTDKFEKDQTDIINNIPANDPTARVNKALPIIPGSRQTTAAP